MASLAFGSDAGILATSKEDIKGRVDARADDFFLLSARSLGTTGAVGDMLRGVELTVVAAALAGLNALAAGFGLNSMAFTLSFPPTAVVGLRSPPDFGGAEIPLYAWLLVGAGLMGGIRVSWLGNMFASVPGIPVLCNR